MMASEATVKAAEAADAPQNVVQKIGQVLMIIGAWPGKISSWLILPIIFCVMAAILGGVFRMGLLLSWETPLPLLGTELRIIGLAELQWHFLAIMVMLGGSYALQQDRHVRVDMLYGNVSPKKRAAIDTVGDLLFLIPFCLLITWLSFRFVGMSFRSGERSDYGGLMDRYLIKSIIPIGLSLLALTGFGRILRNIGFMLSRQPAKSETPNSN